MGTIVEFALKEEPLDVEKMRKCLLKQVSSRLCSLTQEKIHFLFEDLNDLLNPSLNLTRIAC